MVSCVAEAFKASPVTRGKLKVARKTKKPKYYNELKPVELDYSHTFSLRKKYAKTPGLYILN